MGLIEDYKNGKRYGTDWQAPSFQHMNDLVGAASNAQDNAIAANTKATTAESNSSNALTKATTAETNSTNAVNTANTANTKSTDAVNTANSANTKSDNAVSTANSANTKATNAETTATNLTQAPDVTNANNFGTVNVEIIGTGTNKKFKFSNLKGNGIASIVKTSTNKLVDTYTITYDNGGTKTFTVTNGKGITSIAKTSTNGLVDTYTITYNDGTTSTYTVKNGDNIQMRVSGGYFQWKYSESSTWNNIISVGEIATVDQTLSNTSTNAIANKAVTEALDNRVTKDGDVTITGTKTFSSAPKLATNTIKTSSGNTVTIPDKTSTLVDLGTNQTITANKTFSGTVNVSGTFQIGGKQIKYDSSTDTFEI